MPPIGMVLQTQLEMELVCRQQDVDQDECDSPVGVIMRSEAFPRWKVTTGTVAWRHSIEKAISS